MLLNDDQMKSLAATGTAKFGGAAWKLKTCDWIKVDSFRVGGLNYSHAPLIRCENTITNTNALGLDYLDHQILSLDFEHTK
ncbi:MAG: hypothetical protein ABSF34_17335, partial [Verrucomicrobiota bacterium]